MGQAKLHPLTAVIVVLALVMLGLFFQHPAFIVSLFVVYALALLFTRRRQLMFCLLMTLYSGVLIVLINAFFNQNGSTILWQGVTLPVFGHLSLSLEALLYGLCMALKLGNVLLACALAGMLADSDEVISFSRRYLYQLTTVIALSGNILGRLARDTLRIRDVLTSRGVNFNRGSIFKKCLNYAPLGKILLIDSLEGSVERAEAMCARGYNQGRRPTCYRRFNFGLIDVLALLLLLAAAVFLAAAWQKGLLSYSFYPQMSPWRMSSLLGAAIFSLIMAVLLYAGHRRGDL